MKNVVRRAFCALALAPLAFQACAQDLTQEVQVSRSFNAAIDEPCTIYSDSASLEAGLQASGWSNRSPSIDFGAFKAVLIAKKGINKDISLVRVFKDVAGITIEWKATVVNSQNIGGSVADFSSTSPNDLMIVAIPSTSDAVTCVGSP